VNRIPFDSIGEEKQHIRRYRLYRQGCAARELAIVGGRQRAAFSPNYRRHRADCTTKQGGEEEERK